MRRLFVRVLVVGSLVAAAAASVELNALRDGHEEANPIPRSRPRPDIVLVTVDALRADHVSGYGYARATTRTIDRLSERSVVFTDAIAQAPYTKASIASLMTGLYPSAHKAITTVTPFVETMSGHAVPAARTDVLSSRIVTLAEGLHDSGYRTLGFTANPVLSSAFGFGQGFDVFRFFPGQDFATADRIVNEALLAVDASDAKPIFLWLHLMEPHSPYAPPPLTSGMFPPVGRTQPIPATTSIPFWLLPGSPRDLRLYESAYDEEIAAADAAIDVLLRELADLRNPTSTVVVVTADHGEQFLEHGGWEHSDTLYDELIRVPLVIHLPDVPSRVVQSQIQLIDLYPTLLELAGADVPGDQAGRTLNPALHGAQRSEPALSEIANAQYAIRADGWKLIAWADGRQALFDLRTDPREQRDVASAAPARVAALRATMDRCLAAALARGRTIDSEAAPVDARLLERLRGLGYVAW